MRIIILLVFALSAAVTVAGPICLEAEFARNIEAPMELIDASIVNDASATAAPIKNASGGKYLEIAQGKGYPPKLNKGAATLDFTINEDGTYYLWCRTWWGDECGNSLTMNIDGGKPFTFGQDSTFKNWHWSKVKRKLKQLKLTKGKHVLTIKNREDGIKLDQILFTSDKRLIPVGIEKTTQSAPKDNPTAQEKKQ